MHVRGHHGSYLRATRPDRTGRRTGTPKLRKHYNTDLTSCVPAVNSGNISSGRSEQVFDNHRIPWVGSEDANSYTCSKGWLSEHEPKDKVLLRDITFLPLHKQCLCHSLSEVRRPESWPARHGFSLWGDQIMHFNYLDPNWSLGESEALHTWHCCSRWDNSSKTRRHCCP